MTFEELGLGKEILEAISYMGFEKATPVQEKAIPIILDGKDIIGCAQTGTGKTAAFMLPTLHKLSGREYDFISTLIIVPTRELAIQIDQEIQGFSYFLGVSSIAIYGGGDGSDWEQQKKALKGGADIIVATPGKLLSHLGMGYIRFDKVKYLILDEADRMLDIGFHDDILEIIKHLPNERQNLMFSATMPKKIRDFARRILKGPEEISIAISKPAEGVLHAGYLCYDYQKNDLLNSLIADKPNYRSIIIFSSTKKKVSEIVRSLRKDGYEAKGISSDLEQKERENVLMKFKARKIRILVGTNVISRGIDIKDINLVINYDVPDDAEDYVHRVGRTARADTTGVALTFVNPVDMYKFAQIEKLIEREIIKIPVPATLGETPDWNPVFQSKPGSRHKKGKNFKKRSKGRFKRKKS